MIEALPLATAVKLSAVWFTNLTNWQCTGCTAGCSWILNCCSSFVGLQCTFIIPAFPCHTDSAKIPLRLLTYHWFLDMLVPPPSRPPSPICILPLKARQGNEDNPQASSQLTVWVWALGLPPSGPNHPALHSSFAAPGTPHLTLKEFNCLYHSLLANALLFLSEHIKGHGASVTGTRHHIHMYICQVPLWFVIHTYTYSAATIPFSGCVRCRASLGCMCQMTWHIPSQIKLLHSLQK